MDKYYTPELNEFHTDFQYEYYYEVDFPNALPPKWYKFNRLEFNPQNYGCPFYQKDLSLFRVKYLDREDVESLGWACKEPYIWQFFLGKYDRYQLTTPIYKKDEGFPNDEIILIRDTVEDWYLFQGFVKNKSELKKLMKQLNIT